VKTMLWPLTPLSVVMSVSTSGDSVMTPLAVLCGSLIGTRNARTLRDLIFGNSCWGIDVLVVGGEYSANIEAYLKIADLTA
jgi:hypothetical protein